MTPSSAGRSVASPLVEWAMGRRAVVLTLTLLVAGAGLWCFSKMEVDAYPDISAQVVQVITTFPGRAPEEVERQVTIPIELAMANVPQVEVIRSRTIFGLSVVQLQFDEGTEKYWARLRVQENLSLVELPDGATPELGPLATAYGELYRYELVSTAGHDLMELRTLNDWAVITRLLRTPGVAEVSNFGGLGKQFSVTLQPAQLLRYGVSLQDVVDAIRTNNATAGGGVLPRGGMSFVIRGAGALLDVEAIGAIFVRTVDGAPVLVRDVATVELGHQIPSGIFSKDRTDEGVEGIVLVRRGENTSVVLGRVKEAIDELNGGLLPEGVQVVPFYDRTHLVQSTMETVSHSVLLGVTLVVLVLLIFMGSPAMALLVALTIPFSLLFAMVLMYLVDIPIGLLSIGAIDFGIIVDGAVIMSDRIAHRLSAMRGHERRAVWREVLTAALEMERPVFFSMLMIIGAYLPLLTLTSIEGLLFRPMALTLVFALVGALIFALLVVPPLASLLLRGGVPEWEHPLLRRGRPLYAATLRHLLRTRWVVAPGAVLLLSVALWRVVPGIGLEFLPYMDEGVVWVRANFPEGTSLQQTSAYGGRIRELVLEHPDVEFITVQSGRNDSGTDPFPPSRMEVMIGPRPRAEWTRVRTKHELVAELGARLREEFPTTRFNFTQPIIDSVTEDTNGTSADLAVELSGPDLDLLRRLGQEAADVLRRVPGAVDVAIEQEGPQPQLVIAPDRERCARYDVRVEDVTGLIDTALGGDPVGVIYEGERRFDVVVRFDRRQLGSKDELGELPVFSQQGAPIPLRQVCRIELVDGQTTIAREGGRRRVTVRCDIVGRDQGGFVAEAQRRFAEEVALPPGVRVSWLGMFENLERAKGHFAVVLPVTIGLIFALLVLTFGSPRAGLVLLLSVPFAFVGGAVALDVRGMNLNVSTGVGFAALFGIAIMNGVLMVRYITARRLEGLEIDPAIVLGAQDCLRPIVMASLVAILGLVPASLATGLGSDVQRPLATVIVWGLVSATALTLLLVPVFYRIASPGLPPPEGEAPAPDGGGEHAS